MGRRRKNLFQLEKTPNAHEELHTRANVIRDVDDPLVAGTPALLDAQAAVALADDEATTATDEAQQAAANAASKQAIALAKVTSLSNKVDFYDSNVLAHATSPVQAQTIGARVLVRKRYALAPPLGVSATWNVKQERWDVAVERSPGLRVCLVQLATDPTQEASWVTILGEGATRRLTDLAPSVYYLRAAHLRGQNLSPYTAPLRFVVR